MDWFESVVKQGFHRKMEKLYYISLCQYLYHVDLSHDLVQSHILFIKSGEKFR